MTRLSEQQLSILDMDVYEFIKNEIDVKDSRTRLTNAIRSAGGISKVKDMWDLKQSMFGSVVTKHPIRRLRNVGVKCERLLESSLARYDLYFDMQIKELEEEMIHGYKGIVHEIIELIRRLPFCYIPSVSLFSNDVTGGYGWHRVPCVSITLVGEICEKCGYSTIRDDVPEKEHRHRWRHDEVVVLSMRIGNDSDFDRFKQTINRLLAQ